VATVDQGLTCFFTVYITMVDSNCKKVDHRQRKSFGGR
jgi:hypothetical protein